MAELNDTYVVHTAMIRCSMGMRETYLVLMIRMEYSCASSH